MTELIETHEPASLGVERLFFNKNVQTAFAVGQARGVVLLAAAEHGLPVFEYGPHEVKVAVTGYGRADKSQVQRMVQMVLAWTSCPNRTMPRMRWQWQSAWRMPVHKPLDRARSQYVIAFVEGRVVMVAADSAIVQAGGVGYRVFCGPGTLTHLKEAPTTRLYTHHLVREDLQALYGFRTTEELGFFELLTTVTGVGPKVALGIVASRPVADLQLAILQGDEGVLTAVSGVGKRLAARVVLELKEKVSAAGAVGAVGSAAGSSESEVSAALQALGYTATEAREAARGAVAALPIGSSLEDRVKAALRVLRRD